MSKQALSRINGIETFYGMVQDTADALRIFEMCRQGKLGRVQRRLREGEREGIRSGSVFVFDEGESGMKRWTDGRLWSPSRILGNFLIYRELDCRVPRTKHPSGNYNHNHPQYIFAQQGLIKKTISAGMEGHTYHMICYYSVQDFSCKDAGRFDAELHRMMQSTPIPLDLLIGQHLHKPEDALSRSRRKGRMVGADNAAFDHRTDPCHYVPTTPILSVASMTQSSDHDTSTVTLSTSPDLDVLLSSPVQDQDSLQFIEDCGTAFVLFEWTTI